tara:strand:- start:129 stop:536 length:408 start_codon:yes stop_codon:yes gene_type:complete
VIKPHTKLNDDEELLGIYEDKSRWIDRLFSTAGKKTVGFSTEINQFLPIIIGNFYITNKRIIFEGKADKNYKFSIDYDNISSISGNDARLLVAGDLKIHVKKAVIDNRELYRFSIKTGGNISGYIADNFLNEKIS